MNSLGWAKVVIGLKIFKKPKLARCCGERWQKLVGEALCELIDWAEDDVLVGAVTD